MQPYDNEKIEDFVNRFIDNKALKEVYPDKQELEIYLKRCYKTYLKNKKNGNTTIYK
jgi:hypothetical protein